MLVWLILLISWPWHCQSGQELVHNFRLARDDLRPHDIAIIQFETRPLDKLYSSKLRDYDNNYWNVSARWNKFYAISHGHQYAYIAMDPSRPCKSSKYQLSAVWCKVKAMVRAFDLLPKAKAFVYLDSDAVMTTNYSLSDIIGFMRRELVWDFNERPIALNQDGPGWACKNTIEKLKAYEYCLNSGTLMWIRDDRSYNMLNDWWRSADDDYETSKFTSKWRNDWPWEQAQLYLMKEKYDNHVMILSFPSEPYLKWTNKLKPRAQYPSDPVEPWCFSHWPGAYCFITHHCASVNQKGKLIEHYDLPFERINIKPFYIE